MGVPSQDDPKHLDQLALVQRRRRDHIANAMALSGMAVGHTDAQGHNRGALAEVVQQLDLALPVVSGWGISSPVMAERCQPPALTISLDGLDNFLSAADRYPAGLASGVSTRSVQGSEQVS